VAITVAAIVDVGKIVFITHVITPEGNKILLLLLLIILLLLILLLLILLYVQYVIYN
jgi:hypothetical protein